MIPRLSDAFADDSVRAIEELGELAEFRPAGGAARPIYVVVNRKPVENTSGTPTKTRPKIVIRVVNAAPAGIELASLDFDRDRIGIAYLRGGALQDWGFSREVLDQTAGSFRIRLT